MYLNRQFPNHRTMFCKKLFLLVGIIIRGSYAIILTTYIIIVLIRYVIYGYTYYSIMYLQDSRRKGA